LSAKLVPTFDDIGCRVVSTTDPYDRNLGLVNRTLNCNITNPKITLTTRGLMCRGSSVGIATTYGLDDRRVRVRAVVGCRIFTSLYRQHGFWSPPNLQSNEYRGPFPGVKRSGRGADHSLPTSAEMRRHRFSKVRENKAISSS
jgi:hypothetical protein